MNVASTNLPSNREEPESREGSIFQSQRRPERCGQLFPERDPVTLGFPRGRVWHGSDASEIGGR